MMATISPRAHTYLDSSRMPYFSHPSGCGSGADLGGNEPTFDATLSEKSSSCLILNNNPWSTTPTNSGESMSTALSSFKTTEQATIDQPTTLSGVSPWPNPWKLESQAFLECSNSRNSSENREFNQDDKISKTIFDSNSNVTSMRRKEEFEEFAEVPAPAPAPAPPPPRRQRLQANPSPRKQNSHTELGRAVRAAAIKNAEIKQTPSRANSLHQTLLQRRLWFFLIDKLAESTDGGRVTLA